MFKIGCNTLSFAVVIFVFVYLCVLFVRIFVDNLREKRERQERQRRAHFNALRIQVISERMEYISKQESIAQFRQAITKATVTNCPNCGAPYTGKAVCEYCGTMLPKGGD